MPSLAERQRNNIRTGVFVSVTLVLAVAVVAVLSGEWLALFTSDREYQVDYAVRDGVANLAGGAEVRVGGLAMGRVIGVEPRFEEAGLESIRVNFKLDSRITLREGAEVFVKGSIIGSDAWLEIPFLGHPDGEVIESRIEGATPLGLLATVVGSEGAAKTKQILDDVATTMEHTSSLTRNLDEDWGQYDERIRSLLANLDASSADVRALTARVGGEDWPAWAGRIHDVLLWTDDLTRSIDQTVEEGRQLLGDSRSVVGRNTEQVDRIIDNFEITSEQVSALVQHLNQETLARADAVLHRAQLGMDAAVNVLEELDARKERWSADISGALVNANLMAVQLKLVSEEVRRSPWKLLHRPTDDELEHELLYASARSFAVATADLKAAAESARSILDHFGDRLDDDELRRRLEADLLSSLDRYDSAQQRLVEVIMSGETE